MKPGHLFDSYSVSLPHNQSGLLCVNTISQSRSLEMFASKKRELQKCSIPLQIPQRVSSPRLFDRWYASQRKFAVNVLHKEHEVTLVLCLDDRDLRAEGSLCAMTLRSLRVMLYAFAPRAGKPVTLEIEATKRYSSQPLFQIKQV